MAASSSMSSIRHLVHDVLVSVPWWRQQGWIVTTEILMGFLVAWAMVNHIPAVTIGWGLGLVYGVSSLGMFVFRRYGQQAAITLALASVVLFVAFNFLDKTAGFLGLCMSIGVLLFFRDAQSVQSLAWIPVRALRKNLSNAGSLITTSILSAVLLALALVLSGWLGSHWRWLPHALVLVAFIGFVPRLVLSMRGGAFHASKNGSPMHAHEVKWLLTLGVVFNAVNFLGRRLIIPAMIVTTAQKMGWSHAALPLLGGIMGMVGIISAVARAPMMVSGSMRAVSMLILGARLSLVGWFLLCVGLLLEDYTVFNPTILVGMIIVGWVLMELTNRTWSIAYMEQLRVSSVGHHASSARRHRQALYQFMTRKSFGGAVGCCLGGVISPALAPAVALVFLIGCVWVLEKPPQTLTEDSSS